MATSHAQSVGGTSLTPPVSNPGFYTLHSCRIRCDKKVPCGSCTRRGCMTLCPNGQRFVPSVPCLVSLFTDGWKQALSPLGREHGNCVVLTYRSATNPNFCSFVLSDTQELHDHILTMSQRIRQLEDALATAANQHTASGIHPLLSDDLLTIKFGPESGMNGDFSTDSHEDEYETDHNLSTPGSLFKYSDGGTKYFGPSGGSGKHCVSPCFDPYRLRRNQETILLVGPSSSTGFGC